MQLILQVSAGKCRQGNINKEIIDLLSSVKIAIVPKTVCIMKLKKSGRKVNVAGSVVDMRRIATSAIADRMPVPRPARAAGLKIPDPGFNINATPMKPIAMAQRILADVGSFNQTKAMIGIKSGLVDINWKASDSFRWAMA